MDLLTITSSASIPNRITTTGSSDADTTSRHQKYSLHHTLARSTTTTKRHGNNNNNNNNSNSNSNKFQWDDVQATQNVKGMCGADKCFWRSTSDPENVGYLVASALEHYEYMKMAYTFAKEVLEEKCNAKHLYLEPPTKVKVKPKFIRKLNSLRHNDHAEFIDEMGPRRMSFSEHDVFDEKHFFLVIQKVKVAPTPNLMFGFVAMKWEMMVHQDIPKFRRKIKIPLQVIEENLESERKGIECAMEHSSTYWYDLQGLIDSDGNYYHIDVDSQFWVDDPVSKAERYAKRQTLIGKFNEMIQRLTDPPPMGVGELSSPWGDDGDDGADDDE